jgi:phage tail P2-like protein
MSDHAALSRLLPPNSTALETALADAAGLPALVPEIITDLWNTAACPAAHLPWLAWSLSVDEWDSAWNEATQRAVIAASVEIHRKKGTVGAVRKALSVLGHAGRLFEWWQDTPPGTPHTFRADIEIDHRGIDIGAQIAIMRAIAAVKPARSHFTLRLIATTRATAHVGIATVGGEAVDLYPFTVARIDLAIAATHLAIGVQHWSFTTVYPASAP